MLQVVLGHAKFFVCSSKVRKTPGDDWYKKYNEGQSSVTPTRQYLASYNAHNVVPPKIDAHYT
jgi:hypothetical protein